MAIYFDVPMQLRADLAPTSAVGSQADRGQLSVWRLGGSMSEHPYHEPEPAELERLWFESDVKRKLQIAKDVGRAIAQQSPRVAAEDSETFYRGYKKAIDVVWRMFLGD
jgi:hypothetical protein